ncbi:RNA exonuclease 4-like [Penaeus chinensis]|uniref:RNA exonuclease 4-like n=1 Tax=Penaeus chinensis TaxID=139456 RepID=UPI001FB5F262|nr:RNA exonuclease 4-like [Penaeus chinensis]
MAKFNMVQKKRTQNGMHSHQAKTEANQFKKVKFKGEYTQNGNQTNGVDMKSSDSTRRTKEVDLSPEKPSETSNGNDKTQNGETGNHSKEKKANKKKCKWRENLKKKKMRANGSIPVADAPAKRALEEGHEASGPMKRRREEDGTQNGSAAESSASSPKEPAKKGKQFSSNWMQLKTILEKQHKASNPHGISREKKGHKQKKGAAGDAKRRELKEKPDIWFDNVDPLLLETENENNNFIDGGRSKHKDDRPLENGQAAALAKKSHEELTQVIAMDCEMVGVGMDGKESILARVSIVNHSGKVLYDKFVKPLERVVDYRTQVSGIRRRDLEKGEDFKTVQKEVADLLKGKVLVGHALKNDLKVLFLSHPRTRIRDTAKYKGFRNLFKGTTPSLKNLTEKLIGVKIQHGEHSSVQDAQAAMRLYTAFRREWENSKKQFNKKKTASVKEQSKDKKLETDAEVDVDAE